MIRLSLLAIMFAHVMQVIDKATNFDPTNYMTGLSNSVMFKYCSPKVHMSLIKICAKIRWYLMTVSYSVMAGITVWLIIAAYYEQYYPFATIYVVCTSLVMLTERRSGRRSNCNPYSCPQIPRKFSTIPIKEYNQVN